MDKLIAVYNKYALVQGIITALVGGGALFLTVPLMNFFGLAVNDASTLMFRAFGASVVFVSIIHWGTRTTKDLQTMKAVACSNLVEDGALTVLSVCAISAGTFAKTAYLLAAVFFSEVIAAVYVLLLAKKVSSQK